MNQYLTDLQNSVVDSLTKTVNNRNLYYNHVTKTLILIAVFVLLSYFGKKLLNKWDVEPNKKKRIQRSFKNTLLTLCLIGVSIIWINALNSLVIILLLLGLFGVVLIRSTLDNIIGWYFIRKRDYFKVNQRIEIDGKIGKVVGVNFFYFELTEIKNWLSSEGVTGRVIKIPNKDILTNEVFNYDYMNRFVRQEINFLIRHDSNYGAAKKLVLEAMNDHYRLNVNSVLTTELYQKLGISPDPTVNLQVQEGGLALACQFLVDFGEVAKIKSALYEDILERFNEHPEIEFAVIEVKKVD